MFNYLVEGLYNETVFNLFKLFFCFYSGDYMAFIFYILGGMNYTY